MPQNAKETLTFDAEIAKLLQLVIHSLYTNRDIFLRELISNASDACDKLRYEALTHPERPGDEPFVIRLSADLKARTLTISDNGVGMNREELISHLGTIAKSGTQEFLKTATGDGKKDLGLIGQFGVGFYSAFMVADTVEVTSRRAGEAQTWHWSSAGTGEFTIQPVEVEMPHGTRIVLHIKTGKEFDPYLDRHKLSFIAETYSDHISFPIEFVDDKGEAHKINTATALWARPKSAITPEQYNAFYHHVAHSPDTPWMTLHNKNEGKIEYTNLLFIPSAKPFDLYHPDRRRRVKLYIRRVFITDENANLIPYWLRFLRGVIDSEDLPLNISRETLQHSPIIDKIRDGLVKRVLGELKKRAAEDDYLAFWNNFGPIVKEGLCEAIAPKEQILEICRFPSTEGEAPVTLDAYISRMKAEQEHIYYLTGERLEAMKKSPQLEGFRQRGIEVLLFADHVDEFWVNVVSDYKGKPFKSVTRADIALDKLAGEAADKKPADEPALAGLIAALKTIYGAQVKDVRVTAKLQDSPVCLAVGEGDMDIRFEKFLREQKQLPDAAYAKILEINPTHPIIERLSARVAAKGSDNEIADIAWLLLDQAKILEGEELQNPADFSRRMSQLLQKSLAA